MKGVILNKKRQFGKAAELEHSLGQATDTVVDDEKMSTNVNLIRVAMATDFFTYGMEILALLLFGLMVSGHMTTKIAIVTALWVSVIVVDTVFHEVAFTYFTPLFYNRPFTSQAKENEDICKWLFFLGRSTSALLLVAFILKYSPRLQGIVSYMNTPTALFELYYQPHQSFVINDLYASNDFVLLFPVTFIAIVSLIFIGAFLLLFYLCYKGYELLEYCFSKPAVARAVPMASVDDDVSTTDYESTSGAANAPRTYFFDISIPLKRYFSKQMFSFDDVIFLIFVLAVRLTYKKDNVEFFHQLLWRLPTYFCVLSVIAASLNLILGLVMYLSPRMKRLLHETRPFGCMSFSVDLLTYVKHFALFVGAIHFLRIRHSQPLGAVLFLIGVLIIERVLLLARNIQVGYNKLRENGVSVCSLAVPAEQEEF